MDDYTSSQPDFFKNKLLYRLHTGVTLISKISGKCPLFTERLKMYFSRSHDGPIFSFQWRLNLSRSALLFVFRE